jgi:RNA 3'-phosphate cyclase
LPCLLNREKPTTVHFKGGATDTFFSPSFDYFRHVFLGNLQKITGSRIAEIEVKKRGFYPEGGAELSVKIYPQKIKPFSLLEKGSLRKVSIISCASEGLRRKKVAERQLAWAKEALRKLSLPLEEVILYEKSTSEGSVINIVAEFEKSIIGVDNLGRLGKPAEEVGKEAALNFLREGKQNAVFDKYMGDQILAYLALSKGISQAALAEITPHCKSNIWVIEKFLEGKFEVSGNNTVSWKKF